MVGNLIAVEGPQLATWLAKAGIIINDQLDVTQLHKYLQGYCVVLEDHFVHVSQMPRMNDMCSMRYIGHCIGALSTAHKWTSSLARQPRLPFPSIRSTKIMRYITFLRLSALLTNRQILQWHSTPPASPAWTGLHIRRLAVSCFVAFQPGCTHLSPLGAPFTFFFWHARLSSACVCAHEVVKLGCSTN